MTLINFHRVLILTGIAFCLGYAGWELRAAMAGAGGAGAILLAIGFVLLAAALTVYLVRLRSILQLEE